jgi:NAD(P)-dependent dehydrogenase (short-subunit alcohol dehydrogenase family)
MKELADKVVVVTGAASGIGRAAAVAFAQNGARVVVCDVKPEPLEAVARDLGRSCVLAERVDVADRGAMSAFAEKVHAKLGAADVLVNNAGVGLDGGLLNTSLDDWSWVVSINFWGVVHGCHFFVPKMVERGRGGHVVNVASAFGYFAPPNVIAYVATKFAVIGLSQSLRAELSPRGIDVSVVCPGMINTGIIEGTRFSGPDGEKARGVARRLFATKGVSPDRVASAMVQAVRKRRAFVPVTPEAWALYYLKRFAPQLELPLARWFTDRVGPKPQNPSAS